MSETNATPNTDTPAQATTPSPKPGRPTGRRKWLYRLVAMVLGPLVLFGLLELGLRAGGYGRDTRFFLDGAKFDVPEVSVDNREFGRWAFPSKLDLKPLPIPFRLDNSKQPRTFRIFILGESAAQGFPDPSFSFGRILDSMLRTRYPETHFEVVNAAMVAINSHIVLPIARECADHEPDLFVVHLGNNEVVGPFGAAGVLGSYSPSLAAIRANLSIRRTRTGQLFGSLINRLKGGAEGSETWGGMSMFMHSQIRFDDERLTRTDANFRENLRDVCRVGSRAGVPTIVCSIPVNLKDSAPFGSLHAPSLSQEGLAAWEVAFKEGIRLEGEKQFEAALARYETAARIDDRFADLAFREARCLVALGKFAEAREKYLRARDIDALRFRSNATINRTIREVVSELSDCGVHLANAERTFEEASPMNVPGEELFLEHVHMNFSGNYLLARTAFQTLAPILDTRLSAAAMADPPSQQQCAERLAYTDWNELKIVAQVRSNMRQQAPFTTQLDCEERDVRWQTKARDLRKRLDPDGFQRAVRIHGAAVDADKNDWMLRMNFGQLLMEVGDLSFAEEQFNAVLHRLRHYSPATCKLGQIALRTNRVDRAESYFREALRLAPEEAQAQLGLADVFATQGKVDEGLAIYEDLLKKTSDRSGFLLAFGQYLLKNGRLEDAKPRLTESIQLNAENPIAHMSLGQIAHQQGKRDEAIGHYEAAAQIRPDLEDIQKRLSQLKAESQGLKKP